MVGGFVAQPIKKKKKNCSLDSAPAMLTDVYIFMSGTVLGRHEIEWSYANNTGTYLYIFLFFVHCHMFALFLDYY